MTHSHVRKFSNWDTDTDNVPYAACFDNARKENAMMNPNDPEAFNLLMKGAQNNDVDALKASSPRIRSYSSSSLGKISHGEGESNARRQLHHRSRGTQASFVAESASEINNSDCSDIERVKLDHKKSLSVGGSNINVIFSSARHLKRRGSISHYSEHKNKEGTLVPEFGAWDVTDPKSGEGYTDTFRKIREEKQSAYRHFPNKTPSPNNIQNQCGRPSSIFSKIMMQYCCCLFSSESKRTRNSCSL